MRRGITFGFACLAAGLAIAVAGVPAAAGDDIQAILDGLQALGFDEFVDESYKEVLLRTPELVTSLGLSAVWGTGDGDLDTVCSDFVDDSYRLKEGILDLLLTYERDALDADRQVAYDSYLWLLEAWRDEHEFRFHFYPVAIGFSRQIDLYLVRPGYFSAYKVGMMKLLELRERARDELGSRYGIKDFHRAVLLHNCMPLTVLERVVGDAIAAELTPPAPRRPQGRRR